MHGNRLLTEIDMTSMSNRCDGIEEMVESMAVAPSWSSITGKPSFHTVAVTGNYSDLSGKPSIPVDLTPRVSALELWRSNKSPSFGSALQTNLTTNYNILTTLLTNLVGAVNATNVRVNEACVRINSIQSVLSTREITA